jgi:hypothetical protein
MLRRHNRDWASKGKDDQSLFVEWRYSPPIAVQKAPFSPSWHVDDMLGAGLPSRTLLMLRKTMNNIGDISTLETRDLCA